MTHCSAPRPLTDEFLERLVARVPSTGGGTWKLTEVYTGEVLVELPQSTPGGHRARVRRRPRAAQARVGRVAAARSGSRCSSARTRCSSTTRRPPPT